MFGFLSGIAIGVWHSFCFGGFIMVALKIYEWWNDRYYDKKRSTAKKNTPKITIEITLKTNIKNLKRDYIYENFKNFLTQMSAIHDIHNPFDTHTVNRATPQFTFDIVATNETIKMYMTTYYFHTNFVKNLLHQSFEDISLHQVKDPYSEMDLDHWEKKRGSFLVTKSKDIYPLKTYKCSSSDDFGNLIAFMKTIPADSIMAIQYDFQSFSTAGKKTQWKRQFEDKKQEYFGSELDFYTKEEEKDLDNIQRKISSPHLKTKIKWMILTNNRHLDTDIVAQSISAYTQSYATINQKIGNSLLVDSNRSYKSKKWGFLNGWVTKKMNRVYFEKENEYMMDYIFNGIKKRIRTLDKDETVILTPEEIASLFNIRNI